MPQTKSKYYSIYEITYRLWKINGIFVSQILFHEAEVACTHISRGLSVVLVWAMMVWTVNYHWLWWLVSHNCMLSLFPCVRAVCATNGLWKFHNFYCLFILSYIYHSDFKVERFILRLNWFRTGFLYLLLVTVQQMLKVWQDTILKSK